MDKTRDKPTQFDSLERSMDVTNLNEMLWNDKCDYTNIDTCLDLNPNNYNFLTFQLNIRSLLSHQHELNQLLRTLENRRSKIDIILLCETFLSKNTANVVKIPGYIHIGNYQKERKGGGVSILITEGIPHKR